MPVPKSSSAKVQEATEIDVAMMRRAIRRARRAEGRVEPNPMVGCVITKNGCVIGEGHHRRFGGPHAEAHALRDCTDSTRGATAYVTLEPCAHYGKTPPCVGALLEAGVGRVVIGVVDPNFQVAGKSVQRLRRAGVEVTIGVCADEAEELAAPYLTRTCLARPYVIAKWAQTLDGKLATHTGDSQWISSEASRKLVHRLRARVDAIVVGGGTVQADDPLLTARDVPRRRVAHRVVLDSRLRTPPSARIVATAGDTPTLILTSATSARDRQVRRLRDSGVSVVAVDSQEDCLLPEACLEELYGRDMTNVVLEGGTGVLGSFFRHNLVDEAWVFTAPILLGDERVPGVVSGIKSDLIRDAMRPRVASITTVGRDVHHRLRFTPPPSRP